MGSISAVVHLTAVECVVVTVAKPAHKRAQGKEQLILTILQERL
jgi:uncharacterized membrane protein